MALNYNKNKNTIFRVTTKSTKSILSYNNLISFTWFVGMLVVDQHLKTVLYIFFLLKKKMIQIITNQKKNDMELNKISWSSNQPRTCNTVIITTFVHLFFSLWIHSYIYALSDLSSILPNDGKKTNPHETRSGSKNINALR